MSDLQLLDEPQHAQDMFQSLSEKDLSAGSVPEQPQEQYPDHDQDLDQDLDHDPTQDPQAGENPLGIKGEDGDEYPDGYGDGFPTSRSIIREQDRWLPIANGKSKNEFFFFQEQPGHENATYLSVVRVTKLSNRLARCHRMSCQPLSTCLWYQGITIRLITS